MKDSLWIRRGFGVYNGRRGKCALPVKGYENEVVGETGSVPIRVRGKEGKSSLPIRVGDGLNEGKIRFNRKRALKSIKHPVFSIY